MRMGTSGNDTLPEHHVTTDPGLGVKVSDRTDPAPSGGRPQALEIITEPSGTPPPVVHVDRNADTPVFPIAPPSPPLAVPPAPVPARIEGAPTRTPQGDATPVPPETDGLLNGLIASENEAYYRKAKASSQSRGEAAVAFHGKPHAPVPASPTPPPEPAVMLRRSIDDEISNALALANTAPGADAPVVAPVESAPSPGRVERDTDPPAPVESLPERMPEPTVPLPEPRSQWMDKAIAFGAAALAVGALGIILVRWLGGNEADTPPPQVTQAPRAPTPPVPPQVEVAPRSAVVDPPPPVAVPAPSVVSSAPTVEPPASAEPSARLGTKPPRGNPGTRRAPLPGAASGSVEVEPPPKDDVKRSM